MKTIYKVLLAIVLVTSINLSLIASDQLDEIPVGSTAAPSTSVLQTAQRSLAASNQSPLAASERYITSRASNPWDDVLILPDVEEGDINVVGGPVGDISIPIVLIILVMYLVISKKYKNLLSFMQARKQ